MIVKKRDTSLRGVFCVDEEFFKRVKVDVALKGVTLKDYLKIAVDSYLKENETIKK